jgi:hypothetical protein
MSRLILRVVVEAVIAIGETIVRPAQVQALTPARITSMTTITAVRVVETTKLIIDDPAAQAVRINIETIAIATGINLLAIHVEIMVEIRVEIHSAIITALMRLPDHRRLAARLHPSQCPC